ncbi:hypothetical protein SAMD00019534_014750 [Acytostelium subglobosum LB1]|uniref:hypothetical protein n=1 Tax=Acytostelium subglobosum LB1 TaxID=1410327 RepID=UPI000644CFAC|nr:hypothetical protein SAMD00019534_014750 [Acytostelium subglobosum LB1]GAM18300.1 hypothetical protein SAMD00019534_014750 [Acytostelium subglobosum LB1]|eukprot:XP_012757520.1 hypothetical protein SAMD00019534_014750 [Acytostelium subglobosum LB1]
MSKGGGWLSSFSEQITQIKDVITNDDPDYDPNIDQDDQDTEEQIVMLRAEVNKYKSDVAELESKVLESEGRVASITKEFSVLISEKETEMNELRRINDNLKQSLISPTISPQPTTNSINSSSSSTGNIQTDTATDSVVGNHHHLNGHSNSALGITMENDQQLVFDEDHPHRDADNMDINELKLQLKTQSDNYHTQISTMQQLHQEKIHKLTQRIENLLQENDLANEKFEEEQEVLKKENQRLLEQSTKVIDILKKHNTDDQTATVNSLDPVQYLSATLDILTSGQQKNEVKKETKNKVGTESPSATDVGSIDTLNEQLKKSTKELARLRQYLMEVEENHTITDLENEEKITSLQNQLNHMIELNKSIRSDEQSSDKLQHELDEKEEELRRTTTALNNLQSVLEQFQADQEAAIQTELVSANQKIKASQQEINRLQQDRQALEQLQQTYQQAQNTITELTHRISIKEQEYQTLRSDIEPLKVAFDRNINRLSDLCLQEQESVDKRIVSKLFLTYFNVKGNKKSDVLELIAKILNFNDEDKITIGLAKRQWSLIPFFGNGTTPEQQGEKSLTDMWIEFLLKEAGEGGAGINTNINNSIEPAATPANTPMSTPTKNIQLQTPPASPYRPTASSVPTTPVSNSYFSVTPNHNGKLKSTVIYDGDIKNNL